ncbi:hypothetical protein EWM64_g4084 [Hericium alpestre]|uniref:Small ribosomal subunit protein mS29 n=1 Tax=Hericium alpestre TaxID=135208 RepID=A0A4Y9ZZL5_9AGAM|nr:hypothetical protein EWM64_g4084 [Hericium alpestre]
MSTLATATRALSGLPRNAGPSFAIAQQARGYAAQPSKKSKIAKQSSTGFKGKGRNGERGAVKREKRLGTWNPMSPSQLSHPVFQTQSLTEMNFPFFHADRMTPTYVSKALAFPMPENDAARVFGLPKSMLLEYRLLPKRTSVVRDVTLKVADRLQQAKQQSSEHNRIVLAGSPGCGKSYLLLQAVEYASSADWIVMYIPRAINLVNSSSPYYYDLRTQTYLQPIFAYQTLQRFLTVNPSTLERLQTSAPIEIERRDPVPAGTPLVELIDVGLKDQLVAPTVLTALMEELGKQTQFPVLLAIDDFQALFSESTYRSPHFSAIKAWHLSMPRLLLDYASGQKTFARGAVVGALSTADTRFKLSTELRHALGLQPWLKPSPFVKIAPEILEFTKGIEMMRVPDRLSVDEAASLFEVWMKNKTLHTQSNNDELFMAKYAESGGNARDFVWKGLLSTLES